MQVEVLLAIKHHRTMVLGNCQLLNWEVWETSGGGNNYSWCPFPLCLRRPASSFVLVPILGTPVLLIIGRGRAGSEGALCPLGWVSPPLGALPLEHHPDPLVPWSLELLRMFPLLFSGAPLPSKLIHNPIPQSPSGELNRVPYSSPMRVLPDPAELTLGGRQA